MRLWEKKFWTRLFWVGGCGLGINWALGSAVRGAETSVVPAAVRLEGGYHHLGDSKTPDWKGVTAEPNGTRLIVWLETAAPTEGTLRLKQRDVHGLWRIRVNSRQIGVLRPVAAESVVHYGVPAAVLRSGRNSIEFVPDDATDDIALGEVEWIAAPIQRVLGLSSVTVAVMDAGTGEPLPARISIQRRESTNAVAATVYGAEAETTAVRPGVVYTMGAARTLELPAGEYEIAATRGMEWSRDARVIRLGGAGGGGVEPVRLMLRREVDTSGYVAADTHIHTFTFSHHGNSTVEERLVSLAGEGVEFAVATDHNHHTDYAPTQRRLGLNGFFTSVTGNEVTTDNGHFNAFPMDPKGRTPKHKESDWVKLVAGIRQHGAKVIILNHPRWPNPVRNPFTRAGLNRGSGDRVDGTRYLFDAMELVNSTALQADPMYLFVDWFALLNRGERIKAVGTSDTHTVDDPVGQGRTYVRSATDEPSKIRVDEACQNLLRGRASVSLGIFCDVRVEGRWGMGDTMGVEGGAVMAELRVAAPSWVVPTKAMAFLNGRKVAEMEVPTVAGKATDTRLSFRLPVGSVDGYLVFVVLGQGVKDPGWKTYENYTLAATNPVYLDVDGDGKYRSLREEAVRRLRGGSRSVAWLKGAMAEVPAELGVQLVAAAWSGLSSADRAELRSELLDRARNEFSYRLFVTHLPEKR